MAARLIVRLVVLLVGAATLESLRLAAGFLGRVDVFLDVVGFLVTLAFLAPVSGRPLTA